MHIDVSDTSDGVLASCTLLPIHIRPPYTSDVVLANRYQLASRKNFQEGCSRTFSRHLSL